MTNLRGFLLGQWRVERTIADRRLKLDGHLAGFAEFTGGEGDDALLYSERGHLRYGDHEGPAEQSYTYVFGPEGDKAAVYFRDGRFFHEINLGDGAAEFIHDCPPDRYEGSMSLIDSDHWQLDWTIRGPRKDLRIATLYSRMS